MLPPRLVRAIIKQPLLLLYGGLMRIESAYQFTADGRLDDSASGETAMRRFHPSIEQRLMLEARAQALKNGRPAKIIVAKARAVHMSALSAYSLVALAQARRTARIGCLTVGPDNKNQVMYPFLRNALRSLPPPFSVTLTHDNSNSGHIAWEREERAVPGGVVPATTGSVHITTAHLGAVAGVGTRSDLQWITELAKFKGDEEVFRTFDQTLPTKGEVTRFLESTCEGTENEHHNRFKDSWNLQGRCNFFEEGFKWASAAPHVALFLPVHYSLTRYKALPERLPEGEFFSSLVDYERETYHDHLMPFLTLPKVMKDFGIPSQADARTMALRHLYYLRCVMPTVAEFKWGERMGDLLEPENITVSNFIQKKRELPRDTDEAFTDEHLSVFTDVQMREIRQHVWVGSERQPLRGRLDDDGRFVEDHNNDWFWLFMGWNELEDRRLPPWVVFLGIDYAYGDMPHDTSTDFTAGVGLKAPERRYIFDFAVREKPHEFAHRRRLVEQFVMNGSENRRPFICPERTGPGIGDARQIEEDYREFHDRIFYSIRADTEGRPRIGASSGTGKPGYDAASGPMEQLAWQIFVDSLVTGKVRVPSPRMFEQLSNLIRQKSGRLSSPYKGRKNPIGKKDDLCDALKMATFHMWYLFDDRGFDLQALAEVDEYGNYRKEVDSNDPMVLRKKLRDRAWQTQRTWWQGKEAPTWFQP